MKKLLAIFLGGLLFASCSVDEIEGPAAGFYPETAQNVDRGGSVFIEIQVSGPIKKGTVTLSVNNPEGLTAIPAIENGEIIVDFDGSSSATIVVTTSMDYSFATCEFKIKSVSGDIADISSANLFTLIVNPIVLIKEEFESGTGSFSQFSVLGAQTWFNVIYGRNGNATRMSGYSGGSQLNETWLISPAIDYTGWSGGFFSFYSDYAFSGPKIKVFVSTDYSGSGDPTLANWTELTAILDDSSSNNSWTHSGNIDLSDHLSPNTYLSIVYYSNPADGSSNWTIDDFVVYAE